MKELRIVSFNVGPKGVKAAARLLRLEFLEKEARLEREGITAGMGDVRLAVDDPRLSRLIERLRDLGATLVVRAERLYTETDLKRFKWLNLRVRTPGLMGGTNMEQSYDSRLACEVCGAGAVPTPPLLADLGRMGKKKLDMTAHDGHLVISGDLAAVIEEGQLTGVELQPVRRRRSEVDPAYKWLRVTSEWGPMALSSVLEKDDVCPECGRSGHYDPYSVVTEFHYSRVPVEAADFNLTWEYFGLWSGPARSARRPVGGMRHVIVSQRVRDCFRRANVRGVGYEPIHV